jgi:hypothetical protein
MSSPQVEGSSGLKLTQVVDDPSRGTVIETVELTRLTWTVWPCEIVEVGDGELNRLAEKAWLMCRGFRPSPLRSRPGALFMPKGLWAKGRLPEGERSGYVPWPPRRVYEPMRESQKILSEVLRLDDVDQDEKIRKFVSTYGLLGVGTRQQPEYPFDEVGLVKECLKEIKHAARALWAIQTGDRESLERWRPLVQGIERSQVAAYYWSQWQSWINFHLQGHGGFGGGVHLSLELDPPSAARRWSLRGHSLADVLWTALLFRSVRAEPMVECKGCGNPFVPSREGQMFCPPGFADSRSPCLNRWTVSNWRKRQRLSRRRARRGRDKGRRGEGSLQRFAQR